MSSPTNKSGRKPTEVSNPFVVRDEWGDPLNVIWGTEDKIDIRIEDILVGCVRAFDAGDNSTQTVISWTKLLRVYRNVWYFSSESIADYLRCSERQARRYLAVIKLTNPFIERYMQNKSGSNVKGYIEVAPDQVKAGYLYNCLDEPRKTVVKINKKEQVLCQMSQLLNAAR